MLEQVLLAATWILSDKLQKPIYNTVCLHLLPLLNPCLAIDMLPGTATPRCYKEFYVNSFFPRTARLWNSLFAECFPLTYDLNDFSSRVNRHLSSLGSF